MSAESKITELKTNFEAFEEDATELKTNFEAFEEDANRKFTSIQASVRQNKVDIESANKKVIFSAVRDTGNVAKGTIITYNKLVTNVGNAMNVNDGRFTAPISGIYHFSFSGVTDKSDNYISIGVLKNDVWEFEIYDSNDSGNYNTHENLSYSWMMVLRENDRVHLRVIRNAKGFSVSRNSPIWFNGFLLKQED